MDKITVAIWKDGDTQNAHRETFAEHGGYLDIDSAASSLGCDASEVNSCGIGEMSAYGVSFADDPFQAFAGLAA